MMLHSSQHQLPTESIFTLLINEVAALSDGIVLVLADYHALDRKGTGRPPAKIVTTRWILFPSLCRALA